MATLTIQEGEKATVKPRVLIAESDPALAEVYALYLRREGCDVHLVADDVDCWARLHELPPAMLVLDWELPWGGADGVLARLRDDWLRRDVFVVLTTTMDLSVDRLPVAKLPVSVCLRKPFRLAALKAAWQEARRHLQSVFASQHSVHISRGRLAGLTGLVLDTPDDAYWLLELLPLQRRACCRVSPGCLDLIEPDGPISEVVSKWPELVPEDSRHDSVKERTGFTSGWSATKEQGDRK